MINKRIACCVLTYNHPEVINQILGIIPESYAKNGIDLLIFDSSENDATKDIVYKYIGAGCSNIIYKGCRQIKGGDEKMLYILKGNEIGEEYDYVWPIRDRTFFAGDFFEKLEEAIGDEPDLICVCNPKDLCVVPTQVIQDKYNDIVQLFRDTAPLLTSWEAAIYNRKNFLSSFCWERYEKEYELNADNSFIQPVFIFLRLSLIDNPNVIIIHANTQNRFYSKLAYSNWVNKIFEIWAEKWPYMIRLLPNIYDDYKEDVIKTETMFPSLFGSLDSLYFLESKDILNADVFNKYIDIWPELSDIPVEWVDCIVRKDNQTIIVSWINAFNCALEDEDYICADWLFNTSKCMKSVLGEQVWGIMSKCFELYEYEINNGRPVYILEGVHSMEELISRGAGAFN